MLGLIDKPTSGQLLHEDTNVVGLRLYTVATGAHRANSGIVDQMSIGPRSRVTAATPAAQASWSATEKE
tara:strand:- start:2466 stop:2672 length:207 start_codon:yes stop_codon:yes gene_type:complete